MNHTLTLIVARLLASCQADLKVKTKKVAVSCEKKPPFIRDIWGYNNVMMSYYGRWTISENSMSQIYYFKNPPESAISRLEKPLLPVDGKFTE